MLCGRMIAGIWQRTRDFVMQCSYMTKPAGFAVGLLSVWALAEVCSETWLFGCGMSVESNLKVAKQSLISMYFLFSLFESFHKANVPLYQSEIAPPDCCCQRLSSKDVSSFEMVAERHIWESTYAFMPWLSCSHPCRSRGGQLYPCTSTSPREVFGKTLAIAPLGV